MKKRKWIGFYDNRGKKIYEGDLVKAYRYHTDAHGYRRKEAPEKIEVVYKVQWSNRAPEYEFVEQYVKEEHVEFDKNYWYNSLPWFEALSKSIFWKDTDGRTANLHLFELIKHIKGEKKYKALYEVEIL